MDNSWKLKGHCTNHQELFDSLPPNTKRASTPEVQAARKICFSCPVRQICFDQAMREERYDNLSARQGMRGGYTARERIEVAVKSTACARCGSPRKPTAKSLNTAHLTCAPCSNALNKSLTERYFEPDLTVF